MAPKVLNSSWSCSSGSVSIKAMDSSRLVALTVCFRLSQRGRMLEKGTLPFSYLTDSKKEVASFNRRWARSDLSILDQLNKRIVSAWYFVLLWSICGVDRIESKISAMPRRSRHNAKNAQKQHKVDLKGKTRLTRLRPKRSRTLFASSLWWTETCSNQQPAPSIMLAILVSEHQVREACLPNALHRQRI